MSDRRNDILEGLKGQNEQATWGVKRGFWVQADAVLIEAQSAPEAILQYREELNTALIACNHNHGCATVRLAKTERARREQQRDIAAFVLDLADRLTDAPAYRALLMMVALWIARGDAHRARVEGKIISDHYVRLSHMAGKDITP